MLVYTHLQFIPSQSPLLTPMAACTVVMPLLYEHEHPCSQN